MAMHDHHDEDLILELAADPALTEVDVAARVDGCEHCIADVTEQRVIVELLADLDTPTMDGSERAALRTGVFAQLEPAPVIELAQKRSWDWTRLGTVAAALVGVIAVAGLFSVLDGDLDQSDDASDTATVAAESVADADATAAFELAPSAAGGDDGAADDSAEESFEESADEPLGDAASIAAPSEVAVQIGSVDQDGFKEALDRVRAQVAEMTESSGLLQRTVEQVEVSCLDQLPDRGSIRGVATALVDGLQVEAYFDGAGGEFGYASVDCSAYDLP